MRERQNLGPSAVKPTIGAGNGRTDGAVSVAELTSLPIRRDLRVLTVPPVIGVFTRIKEHPAVADFDFIL